MSNPSESFECSWRGSRALLLIYLALQMLALGSALMLELPWWGVASAIAVCTAHALWVLPRQILLTHPSACCALRRDASGWALWSAAHGWRSIQLQPDSLALPALVVLRWRFAGERRVRGLCIAQGAMSADAHRRLRLRLKFSRKRWAAAE